MVNKGLILLGVVVAVGLTSALLLVLTLQASQREYTPAIVIEGERKLPEISNLVDQYGKSFNLDTIRGKVVLIFFGYSHCPDVCPVVLSKYAMLLDKLGRERDKVALIFVTTDPERDTPEVLRRWVSYYNDEIIALTGPRENLEKIWEKYGVYVEKTPGSSEEEYFVAHSSFIFVADKDLNLRFVLTPEMDIKEYVDGVKYLLSK